MSEASMPGAGPPPPSGYSYPSRSSESDFATAPQPMLPPMSSLLPRLEHIEGPHNLYRRQLPAQQDIKHPLWLSERDPHAPVQHIYHAPHPSPRSRNTQYPTESVLVPVHQQGNLSYQQEPAAPPRQIKRIVQRRIDVPKDYATAEMVSPISNPDPYRSHPPSHSTSPFQRTVPLPPLAPPQGQNSRSLPISGLLSDSPRLETSLSCKTQPLILSK